MKILSCHIENFGKIKNRDYDFSNQITCFFEENGAGKSTLASFIKAMFYGLEGYKVNSTEFCDRQHFYPFEGGNFGGNLTFEKDGKTYKIERFFGEKSQTQDVVTVYLNGSVTDELGLDIGKAVFGIDKEAFERTAFISGEEIEIKSNSSINQKLSSFLNGASDDFDVDDALSTLEKLAKDYKKSNRAKDKISEVNEEILSLNEKIANAEAVSKAINNKYQTLDELKTQIDDLSKKALRLQKQSKALSEWEYYERLLLQIEEERTFIKELKSKYSGNVPSLVEVQNYGDDVYSVRELNAKSENGLNEGEHDRLYRLEKAFEQGVPTSEDMLLIQKDIDELSALSTQLSLESKTGYSNSDQRVINVFSSNPPTDDKVNGVNLIIDEYKEVKKEYDQTPDTFLLTKKKSGLKYAVIAVISLILGVVGVITLPSILGIVLTAVGGLGLLASAFLYLSEKASGVGSSNNIEKYKLSVKLSECEDKIKALLLPYGYYSGNGVLFDYATFISDYNRYRELTKQLGEKLKIKDSLTNKINSLKTKISSFFLKYGLQGENFISNFTRLQSGIDELYSLKKRLQAVSEQKSIISEKINVIQAKINAFNQKYNIVNANPSEILSDVKAFESRNCSLEKLIIQTETYKKEKNITKKPSQAIESLDDINALLSERQKEYQSLKLQIVNDEYIVDGLDGYYIDKESAEEKLSLFKQKHKLLTLSREYIMRAEQNLKDKYVKPVKDEFVAVAKLLEEVLGEKVTMTKNFEVRFERAGKERIEKHLSSGMKAICAFCFRIAMIKNMYQDVKPFLILDDPFVTLDEVHLSKIKALLKDYSKDMQIIYFTCHESRTLC